MADSSDQFGASTAQDLINGADGIKSYGWNALNISNSNAFDANITNAGKLTIETDGATRDMWDAVFTVPFIFKNVTGDFDVKISLGILIDSFQDEISLIARDPGASAGEDWVSACMTINSSIKFRDTVNGVTTEGTVGVGDIAWLRIKRVGSTLYLYGALADEVWTWTSTVTRTDFASTIQLGIAYKKGYGATQPLQIDSFIGSGLDDSFGSTTQQDFKTGAAAGDGAKSYGWSVLNSANADAMDVNGTNAGQLTIDLSTTNSDWYGSAASGPYVYKDLAGDFDIEMLTTNAAETSNSEFCGILIRDPTASAGEDWIRWSVGYSGSLDVYSMNTTNNSSSVTNYSVTDRYLRMVRNGDTFRLYSKANSGDAWTFRKAFVRSDFAASVQVGLFAISGNASGTYVAQVDYFNIAYLTGISSDQFDSSTAQDLKSGGDGIKGFGWNVLNSANADTIDVNSTNAGELTINLGAASPDWYGGNATGPFVYQIVEGDFDIESLIANAAETSNYEGSGFLIRDPDASAGEDWIRWAVGYSGGLGVYAIDTANNSSGLTSFGVSDRYLRVTRVGDLFTLYSKANSGDSWTQRKQYTRSDFATSLQVGLITLASNTAGTYVGRFDYYKFPPASLEKVLKVFFDIAQSASRRIEAVYGVGFKSPVARERKVVYDIGFASAITKSMAGFYLISQAIYRAIQSNYDNGFKLPVMRGLEANYHFRNATSKRLNTFFDIGYAEPVVRDAETYYHVTGATIRAIEPMYGIEQPTTKTSMAVYGIRQPISRLMWMPYHIRAPEIEIYNNADDTLIETLSLGLLMTGAVSNQFEIHLWNDKSAANNTLDMSELSVTLSLADGNYSGGSNSDGQEMVDEKWFEIKSNGVSGTGITDDAQASFTAVGGDPATGGLAIGDIPNGAARHLQCRVNVPQDILTAFALNPRLVIRYKAVY